MPQRVGTSPVRTRRRAGRLAWVLLVVVTLAAGPASSVEGGPADGPGQASAGRPADGQRLLARPTPGMAREFASSVASVGAREVDRIDALGVAVLRVGSHAAARAVEQLSASPAVDFVEPDHAVSAFARVPDDPLYDTQWSAEMVDAPAAWSVTTGAAEVVVAVLDTGVDGEHEDLQGAVSGGANFVAPAEPADDDHGHGTLTAGVAAARADNGRGVAGLCWHCTVLPVKVLDETGAGSTSSLAAGIVHATDVGAEVINMSLGSPGSSNTLQAAVTYADERGVLLVAAAGNAGTTEKIYPAAYPAVVGVAAVDQGDQRYSWSSYGSWADVAAPGCTPSTDFDPDRRYSWYCGTSAASPVVAGIAGLAFSLASSPDHTEVRAALRATAVPVGDIVAHGRVDAHAVATTLAASEPEPEPSPTPEPPQPPGDPIEPLPPPPSEPEPEPELEPRPGTTVVRWAGADRYRTAVAISKATFPGDVETVFLATGEQFPDALAGGAAAAVAAAPVLLTPRDVLPDPVIDELRRLSPARVVVVGGRQAVAPELDRQVAQATGASVRRIAGADRYATAAEVAATAFSGASDTVYIATGETFPDALAGVPAAATDRAPLLLTQRHRLADATRDALAQTTPRRIVVLGGEQAVSAEVFRDLRTHASETVRVAGPDRYATAAEIAARAFPTATDSVLLATGQTFPDALAGGPSAATQHAPILLTAPQQLPASTGDELTRLGPQTVGVLGGVRAISDATAHDAAEAASQGAPE